MSVSISNIFSLTNGQAADICDVTAMECHDFCRSIIEATEQGLRISALFGQPVEGGRVRLWAVLAHDNKSVLLVLYTDIEGKRYDSLTPFCTQAHWFEREIFEQCGLEPCGHPWLKPIRFSARTKTAPRIGDADFFRVEGEEVHEVAVGPVHAGIIEPGHFRFQCHGENVFHLEISLGYQHRGVEGKLIGGPDRRTHHYMETLSGDSSIGHALAYSELVEALGATSSPARAQVLRGIALELERIANHTGDLGALAGDVGYLPTLSYCGRIRGDVLNMTGLICGNRFGRGLVKPGGTGFDIEVQRRDELLRRLDILEKDLFVAIGLLWNSSSVMARFEATGTISGQDCVELGLVGPAARACGVERDIRCDLPHGIFQLEQIPVSTCPTGDVFARGYVRWLEIQRSVAFIREQLKALPAGNRLVPVRPLKPGRIAVSLVEGWRGEICHVALSDPNGQFAAYKVVDPSFHNWFGLAYALRGQQISDFPLCNKSFNLSYCGHDL
jgi:Ni,Fe-hydrogenase III large subunit